MQITLDKIRINGGTQQRPIDDHIVDSYMVLMQEIEFPPIDVMFDGKDYWLWNGFHRYHAARKLGKAEIAASTLKGTNQDAVWMSFSANKAHGLPRQKGVVEDIIKKILRDKVWAKKTLTEIARHVGITQQYVSKIKDKLATMGSRCKKGDTPQDVESYGTTSCTIEREKKVVVTRNGKQFKQVSQENQYDKKAQIEDDAGNVLPDKQASIFVKRQVIKEQIGKLDEIRNFVKHKMEERDPVFALLHWQRFDTDSKNLRSVLKSACPHALCPYCGGDTKDCKPCGGLGLVNETTYTSAPRELK